MNSLAAKIADILPELEAQGTVYLFAMAEREDVERWDVVLSSTWADDDWAAAVRTVVALLKPRLSPEEITLISRIGVLRSDDPRMQEVPTSLDGVLPENNHMINLPLFGVGVRRAFIFKAQRPRVLQPEAA